MFRNQRGSPAIVFLCFLIVAMPLLSVVTDLALIQGIKVKARHDLNLACKAAANQIDLDALADAVSPQVYILADDARAAYDTILRANMKLDSANNPLAGSISSGTVQTVFFKVINQDELPYSYTYYDFTEEIFRPSVTAIITFPVQTSPFLRLATGHEFITLTIHSTVGPEIKPQDVT